MLQIFHAADFHLDAPFTALPADKAAARREEQRELLTRLSDLARTKQADLVLLAGDLLDGAQVYHETAEALSRALGQTGCPVFISPGNHDFWSARSAYAAASWPENVHIFSSKALEPVVLPELGCAVHGAAFVSPGREDSPLSGFSAPKDGLLHLGLFHGDVDGRGKYGPLPSADIAASGLDYLALGHVHAATGLQWADKTPWAYPGCPEGRGFDETGEKGVLWVTLGDGPTSAEFIPLCKRRYGILEVDLTAAEDPKAALLDALPEGAREDIYRVIFTGEWGSEGLKLSELTALAEPWFYSVSLRDNTRVRRDLWARAEEDTLTGLFLRGMRARMERAEAGDAALLEEAVRFGLAALEHGEDCRP